MIVTRLLGDYLSFLYFNRDIELYGKVVNIKKLARGGVVPNTGTGVLNKYTIYPTNNFKINFLIWWSIPLQNAWKFSMKLFFVKFNTSV